MGERYLDALRFQVRAYEGRTVPKDTTEAVEVIVDIVDGQVDPEELLLELEREVEKARHPYGIEQRLHVGSWGADWGRLMLSISTAAGGPTLP